VQVRGCRRLVAAGRIAAAGFRVRPHYSVLPRPRRRAGRDRLRDGRWRCRRTSLGVQRLGSRPGTLVPVARSSAGEPPSSTSRSVVERCPSIRPSSAGSCTGCWMSPRLRTTHRPRRPLPFVPAWSVLLGQLRRKSQSSPA
jgi:hypothetical protein